MKIDILFIFMNYTINQLRIFLKVVEKRSITEAAEALFMTQPAVSIQLKNFQEQFDIPLTEHVGRNIQITEFGYEIAKITERAIDELSGLQYKTKQFNGLIAGRLRLAAASTGKYVIPYFLSDFMKVHRGIDLRLDVTNKQRVVESLKNNEVDFAIISVLPDDLSVEELVLVENKLYLVGASELYNEDAPLIYREKGSATRKQMEIYFKEDVLQVKKIELTSNEAVKQAVMAGLGNSILPIIGIKNELLNKELYIYQRKDLPLRTKWRLVWLKNKQLSPVAKAYLDYIKEHKEQIENLNFKPFQLLL